MFTQIRALCGQFFPVADSRIYSGRSSGETCALITPETTLRIPAGYIMAAYNVPVGGIIGETIFSDSIDVSQCRIDSGREIEFVLVGGMRVTEHKMRRDTLSMNSPVVSATAWGRWRSIRNA